MLHPFLTPLIGSAFCRPPVVSQSAEYIQRPEVAALSSHEVLPTAENSTRAGDAVLRSHIEVPPTAEDSIRAGDAVLRSHIEVPLNAEDSIRAGDAMLRSHIEVPLNAEDF